MPPDSGVAVGVDIDGAIAGDAAVIDGEGDAAAVAVGAAEYEGANDAAVGVFGFLVQRSVSRRTNLETRDESCVLVRNIDVFADVLHR